MFIVIPSSVLLSLIAAVILLSTWCHFIQLDKTPVITQTVTQTETLTDISELASDETTPLVTNTRQNYRTIRAVLIKMRLKSGIMRYFVQFGSLKRNYSIVTDEQRSRSLAFLNGIRVLSLFWVILGHTLLFSALFSG